MKYKQSAGIQNIRMDWEKKIVSCLHLFYNELYDWLWFIYDIGQN